MSTPWWVFQIHKFGLSFLALLLKSLSSQLQLTGWFTFKRLKSIIGRVFYCILLLLYKFTISSFFLWFSFIKLFTFQVSLINHTILIGLLNHKLLNFKFLKSRRGVLCIRRQQIGLLLTLSLNLTSLQQQFWLIGFWITFWARRNINRGWLNILHMKYQLVCDDLSLIYRRFLFEYGTIILWLNVKLNF